MSRLEEFAKEKRDIANAQRWKRMMLGTHNCSQDCDYPSQCNFERYQERLAQHEEAQDQQDRGSPSSSTEKIVDVVGQTLPPSHGDDNDRPSILADWENIIAEGESTRQGA